MIEVDLYNRNIRFVAIASPLTYNGYVKYNENKILMVTNSMIFLFSTLQ